MGDRAARTAISAALAALREARWILGHRVRPYAVAAAGAYLAWLVIGAVQGYWLYQNDGAPVPADFIAYWSAARMALEGRAAEAYQWLPHHAVQVAAIGRVFEGFFAWHNPPHFLLLLVPFALPPYVPAWLLFNAVTAALFVWGFSRVLPMRGAWMLALGAPATFFCVIAGQLGFLVGALTAAALLLLDKRPLLAGVALALLTIKPQFGVLYPLLLLATGRWRVFLSAAVMTLTLLVLSALVFGLESWKAFAESLTGETMAALRRGGSDWSKLQSIYAAAYLVTGAERVAMAVHAVAAICVASVVLWLWRIPASGGVRNAAAIVGGFLLSPYAYVYDAPVLVLAAGFLAREMLARGALPWERLLVCLAVAAPASFYVTGAFATPAAMLTILALCVRRALAERRP